MQYLTENEAIRQAMLNEQSAWLEEADKAETFTQIAIAKVIAEAFENAAAKYKTKETQDDGNFLGTLSWHFGDDASPTPDALPEQGERGGSQG